MDSWHSYPKIYSLGHRAVQDIFKDPVVVEEKVDGSQFSFGRSGDDLLIRSKGCVMNIDAPEKMFQAAADTVKCLSAELHDGWTYRGEYLARQKHNALAYDRIPAQHIIIFDINTGNESYLSPLEKRKEAERLGLETVPVLGDGVFNIGSFRELLNSVSILGGQRIEGVVVKNYSRFCADGKAMFGKFVSESFKEIHGASWRETNPVQADIVEQIVDKIRTPARWAKAVQHLRDAGDITDSPRDIGPLIKEVQSDTMDEAKEEIAQFFAKWALPKVQRGLIRGLPEWYKNELLKKSFE